MSLEYEVRSDDDYSRDVPTSVVRELLRASAQLSEGLDGSFLHEREGYLLEIDFGAETINADDRVQWISLRVPAGARLSSATRAIEIGGRLAQDLGWRLFDPQSGLYVEASDLLQTQSFRSALEQLLQDVRSEPPAALWARLWLRARRQSWTSVGQIVAVALLLVFASDRLIGFGFGERLGLSLAVVALLSLLTVAGDVLLDVLGEVHVAADARRASKSH